MSKPVFETFVGTDGQVYAHLKAGNGRIIFTSEGYAHRDGAEAAIFTVIGWVNAGYYDLNFVDDHDVKQGRHRDQPQSVTPDNEISVGDLGSITIEAPVATAEGNP